jgi:hypothetical protein
MDHIIQRLQIETLKAQMSLLQLGCAYLAERCASPKSIAKETWEATRLMENASKESRVLRCELNLLRGSVRPMWG